MQNSLFKVGLRIIVIKFWVFGQVPKKLRSVEVKEKVKQKTMMDISAPHDIKIYTHFVRDIS